MNQNRPDQSRPLYPGGGGGRPLVLQRVVMKTGAAAGHLLQSATSYTVALYGVNRSSTRITSLTTDVDPAGTGTISQTGIGRALLYSADGTTTTPVLVINDDRSPFQSQIPEGTAFLVATATTIAASGGAARKAVVFLLP